MNDPITQFILPRTITIWLHGIATRSAVFHTGYMDVKVGQGFFPELYGDLSEDSVEFQVAVDFALSSMEMRKINTRKKALDLPAQEQNFFK